MLDVVAALRDAAGVAPDAFAPVHEPGRLGELQRSSLDVTRARDELGFTASTTLTQGVAATLEHLRAARA